MQRAVLLATLASLIDETLDVALESSTCSLHKKVSHVSRCQIVKP